MLFRKEDVIPLDVTVEQVTRFFVSRAIASPKVFPTKESL
jgi:uncharacterized membrane protein